MARAVVSRVKILAGLNIAERRLPQDGRARARIGGNEVDLRIATMPTMHGEAVVIRILVKEASSLDLSRLGMSAHDLKAFAEELRRTARADCRLGPDRKRQDNSRSRRRSPRSTIPSARS